MQPGKLFFGPSFQHGMHGLPTHIKVACDRLGVPSLGMQQHNGTSSLKGIINLGIAREAACRAEGLGPLARMSFYSLRRWFAAKFHKTNGGEFMRAEGGIFRVQDSQALVGWEEAVPAYLAWERAEEVLAAVSCAMPA